MPPPLDVEAFRSLFPGLDSVVYMNTGWQGPMPRPVLEAVAQALALEAAGPTAPEAVARRLRTIDEVRAGLSTLIGAHRDEIAFQENTTAALNAVLWALELRPGDEVLTTSAEHPALAVPLLHLRRRLGIVVKVLDIPPDDDDSDLVSRLEALLGRRTRLLALSHVTYGTGRLLPVAALARLAHQVGALVLVDAAQSVGQMPVSVAELECDFMAFPGYKWLLGPAGSGVLWMRRDLLAALSPAYAGARLARSYRLPDSLEPATSAASRWELGTRSVPLLEGLLAAVQLAQDAGLEAIAARCRHLATYARRRLAAIAGVRVLGPAHEEAPSGLVSFVVEGIDAWQATAALWEWGRIVARTVGPLGATRLSLHAFNTEAEIDLVAELLDRLRRHGPPPHLPSLEVERRAVEDL